MHKGMEIYNGILALVVFMVIDKTASGWGRRGGGVAAEVWLQLHFHLSLGPIDYQPVQSYIFIILMWKFSFTGVSHTLPSNTLLSIGSVSRCSLFHKNLTFIRRKPQLLNRRDFLSTLISTKLQLRLIMVSHDIERQIESNFPPTSYSPPTSPHSDPRAAHDFQLAISLHRNLCHLAGKKRRIALYSYRCDLDPHVSNYPLLSCVVLTALHFHSLKISPPFSFYLLTLSLLLSSTYTRIPFFVSQPATQALVFTSVFITFCVHISIIGFPSSFFTSAFKELFSHAFMSSDIIFHHQKLGYFQAIIVLPLNQVVLSFSTVRGA